MQPKDQREFQQALVRKFDDIIRDMRHLPDGLSSALMELEDHAGGHSDDDTEDFSYRDVQAEIIEQLKNDRDLIAEIEVSKDIGGQPVAPEVFAMIFSSPKSRKEFTGKLIGG